MQFCWVYTGDFGSNKVWIINERQRKEVRKHKGRTVMQKQRSNTLFIDTVLSSEQR